jgi:ABC-type lipoprotein export system ATPase subunit
VGDDADGGAVNAIEARDVFRVYSTPEGDAAALQGLTLAVQEREVLVVLGPSGSGKSTLLRLLAGLDRPSAGTVSVFGHDVARLRGRSLSSYRSGVLGYVEQHYSRSLDPDLTSRELVGVQLALGGADRTARSVRADELLERVGLGDKRAARPGELSGGEQQRVAVCAALAHRPRLLLADEPTGELDAASAALVYELIGELAREQGCTTVIVSHDIESTGVADRIVRVRDGRVSEESAREAGGEETLVVGRGGWVRLPEELLVRAGIGGRARAELGREGIVVSAAGVPPDEAVPAAVPAPTQGVADGRLVAEVRHVRKSYGRGAQQRVVLDGLEASFAAGTLVAVTGPSGSGKTTLLHVLAGLVEPDEGDVLVLGRPVEALDREARAALRRESVAVIGQDPGLTPFLSARENVELGLAIRGVAPDEAQEAALEALARVGLTERAEQRAGRLSAGERQRVAIARALAAGAALLLADEPTARLDEANALAVGALFSKIGRESGAAVVVATHDPLVVEQADATLALGGYSPQVSSSSVSAPGRRVSKAESAASSSGE